MRTWNVFYLQIVYWNYICKGRHLDNKGTEFIIGFPENVVHKVPQKPEVLITTDSVLDVLVNITAPRFPENIHHYISVSSGISCRLQFTRDLRKEGTGIAPNALHITAENEISVVVVNTEHNSNDAFLALPTDVLGNEYYAVTWSPPQNASEILVIGINDSTTVNIHLPNISGSMEIMWNGHKYGSNEVITEIINRSDIFQIQAKADLSGTHITSNNIIGVLSGNKRTPVGDIGYGRDHLVEMLPHVGTFGKTFVTVPFPGQTSGDVFKVLACQDNTFVSIQKEQGISNYTIQSAGGTYEFDSPPGEYIHLRSDNPVLLVQFLKSPRNQTISKSDPVMMIVTPLELYAANYSFTTPRSTKTDGLYFNVFMFVIKESEKDGLKLDDSPITAHITAIEGTDYVGGYVSVTDGDHIVQHDSPITTYAGYLYGATKHESYATPVGLRLERINKVNRWSSEEPVDVGLTDKVQLNTTVIVSGDCECSCPYFVSNKKQNVTAPKPKVLKVNKKQTSRYRASKISAPDTRPSAVTMGSACAICLLAIPLVLIVISDIPLLIKHMRGGATS